MTLDGRGPTFIRPGTTRDSLEAFAGTVRARAFDDTLAAWARRRGERVLSEFVSEVDACRVAGVDPRLCSEVSELLVRALAIVLAKERSVS